MWRRLIPVCLILAIAGCGSPSTPPTPTGGAATNASGTKNPEVAHGQPDGADSGVSDVKPKESATEPTQATGNEVADREPSPETESNKKPKTAKGDAVPQDPVATGVEAALVKLHKARTPELLKTASKDLEKALEDEPD